MKTIKITQELGNPNFDSSEYYGVVDVEVVETKNHSFFYNVEFNEEMKRKMTYFNYDFIFCIGKDSRNDRCRFVELFYIGSEYFRRFVENEKRVAKLVKNNI